MKGCAHECEDLELHLDALVFTVRCRRLNAGRGVMRKRIMFPLTKTQALLSLSESICSVQSWIMSLFLSASSSSFTLGFMKVISSLLHLLCCNSASVWTNAATVDISCFTGDFFLDVSQWISFVKVFLEWSANYFGILCSFLYQNLIFLFYPPNLLVYLFVGQIINIYLFSDTTWPLGQKLYIYTVNFYFNYFFFSGTTWI